MTQINNNDILNNTITGASIFPTSGFYNETENYSINDHVFWNGRLWLVLNSIIGTSKGDLVNQPSTTNPNYREIKNTIATSTNGSLQAFNDTAVAINLGNQANSAEVTIGATTFTVNTNGTYKIKYNIFGDNTSSIRSNPICFIEVNGVLLNGSTVYGYARNVSDGGFTMGQVISLNLSANDVIEFFIQNDHSNNLELTNTDSLFEIEYCPNTKIYE